jgi:predicted dehydrogenase
MKKRLKVAIVGLGNIGHEHFKKLKMNKKIEVTSVYDINDKIKKILPKTNKIENFFLDIFKNELDCIVIASPDQDHCYQITKSLQKGVNVFSEKPLCNSLSELNSIYNAWKNNRNLKIKTNLLLREAEIYKWLKNKIEKNYFGKIYSIDSEYLYGRKNKIVNGWRRYSKNYSGIRGGGVHMIDVIIWFLKELPISVYTVGNNIAFKKYNLSFNDYNKSILRFKSGVIAQVNSNLSCIHKHHHTIKIFGSKKTFIYDDKGPRVYYSSKMNYTPKKIHKKTLPEKKTLYLERYLKNFYSRKEDYFDSTEYHLNLVSLLNACVDSSNKKKEMKIKYICKKN